MDDDVTRNRYEELKSAGLLGVLISADPYHQVFVPPERRLYAAQYDVKDFFYRLGLPAKLGKWFGLAAVRRSVIESALGPRCIFAHPP